jgi:hypothetical protein
MANYNTLKTAIQQVVKTNGNKEITGALLQQSLLAMVTTLGENYQFGGLVSPTDTYTVSDSKVVFLATEEGNYPAFGNLSVGSEEIALFYWDTHWYKKTIPTAMGLKADLVEGKVPSSQLPSYMDGDKMDVTAHAITALQSQIEALQLKIAEITSGQVVIPSLMTDRLTSVSDNMHISGSGAPTVPPDYLFQEYLDIVAKVTYKAYGTTAVSDWKLI